MSFWADELGLPVALIVLIIGATIGIAWAANLLEARECAERCRELCPTLLKDTKPMKE